MRSIFVAAAAAVAAIATPALANEARVEVRTGAVWASGSGATFSTLGVATGYDMDIGSGAFAGIEASADKLLVPGAKVDFGVSAGVGANVSESGKLYAIGGYLSSFDGGDDDDWTLGAGYQHSFGKVYVKAEYRRGIDTKLNAVLTGLGVKF